MSIRTIPPIGAPCWADLWTSDVEGSRRFYHEVLGWEAGDPSPEFGGYFMFLRDGVPVAGGMGDRGGMKADNTWKVYLATDDISRTVKAVEAGGGQVASPAMPVADLGVQAVFVDPTGATVGSWQPGAFPGFSVLNEHGAPSWFELLTRDHDGAVIFYRSAFRWVTTDEGAPPGVSSTQLKDPEAAGTLAGIMDASGFLPEGERPAWKVYWEVGDVAAACDRVTANGGTVRMAPQDTPYGTLASAADPAGAAFSLRTSPA